MNSEAVKNSAIDNVQKEAGRPKSQDAYKLIDGSLFFWLGYNQFIDKATGQYDEPKKGITIGNIKTKRYSNFPATRSFYEMFKDRMINDILPAMEKFCDLEEADEQAPRVINNL